MGLKIGDKCVPNGTGVCGNYDDSGSYIVITDIDGNHLTYDIHRKDGTKWGNCNCFKIEHVTLNSPEDSMNTLQDKLLSPDVKELMKAGLVNSDMTLTSSGNAELMNLLTLTNLEALAKRAKAINQARKTS